ncbi:DciA family protein [Streptomyces sp. NPDC006339]|uniref:DciA family protein n=1 Tax=Streptomyces sp. NPDC006339 TaxID=3156755 RepID=UPI0033BDAEC5
MTNSHLAAPSVPEASGADLARIALHQAREAARQRGAQTRAPRRPKRVTLQRDRRDPAGFATVIQSLITERAWDVPASGGSVLDQWPDIAAAVAPNLAAHTATVAFDSPTGRLSLRPDSPAYGTQLRLLTARIIDAANQRVGRSVVREVRVLPAGPTVATPEPAVAARPAAEPAGAVKTRENASAGYRRALNAHLVARGVQGVHSSPGHEAGWQEVDRAQSKH